MAEEITVVGGFTPDVGAAADLRTHQWKLVQFTAAGVKLADAVGSAGLAPFVLWNAPNSGGFCTLVGGPNVAKLWAEVAITRGRYVAPSAVASGFAVMSPVTSLTVGAIGLALSACASGSLFSCKLSV